MSLLLTGLRVAVGFTFMFCLISEARVTKVAKALVIVKQNLRRMWFGGQVFPS